MTELGITASVDEPFLETGIVAGERGDTWLPVSLNGRGFLIDMLDGNYERRSLELLAEQRNPGLDKNPLVSPELWRRSQESWKQGAGQEMMDREGALPYRYFRSWNVNPWDEWGFDLLPKVDQIRSLSGGGACYSTTFGVNGFAVVSGTTIYRWTNLPTSTSDTAHGPYSFTTVRSITSDGKYLYVGHDSQITRIDPSTMGASTFATMADPIQLVRYVKGFILAAAGNVLYDVSSGTPTAIYTHPRSDFRWVDAVDGLTVGYVLGGIGDKWMVYKLPVKDNGTTFDPPSVAAMLPDGEIGYALGAYLGYIAVGTGTGFRFAAPGSNGDLTYGRLVDTGSPVRSFEGQDRFLWYTLDNGGGAMPLGRDQAEYGAKIPVAGQVGIGRCDLSTFTSDLTPAYAPDLNVTGSGVVSGCATVGGRRVFVVEGLGVYMESTTLSSEGWVTMGDITFDSVDEKVAVYAQVNHDPLDGEIDFAIDWDRSGVFETVRSNISEGSISFGNIDLDGRDFVTASVKVTIRKGTSSGPRVSRVEMRALPSAGIAAKWVLPIILSEEIEHESVTATRSVSEDKGFLIGLVDSRKPLEFREGDQTYLAHATEYLWKPTHLTAKGDDFNGRLYLTVKELR